MECRGVVGGRRLFVEESRVESRNCVKRRRNMLGLGLVHGAPVPEYDHYWLIHVLYAYIILLLCIISMY